MAEKRVQRRLAAIMAADIVGYSRLIETNEARTLAAIREIRSQVLDPLIASHKGRTVKLMGDGTIVEFGSAVDAVACAVALQQGVTVHQAEVSPESRIVFRVGINLGDVVVEGDDLFGDGVNIAARLEAFAEPGGISIGDTVRQQLAGKTDFAFEDTGEHTLKNIAQPVRVWRWAREPVPTPAGALLPLPDRPSIAVLPFDNLGGQGEETYFSDGIAACFGQLGDQAQAEAQAAAILNLRPGFSIADFMRRDILLEREEDREHLREGLIKAGLPP